MCKSFGERGEFLGKLCKAAPEMDELQVDSDGRRECAEGETAWHDDRDDGGHDDDGNRHHHYLSLSFALWHGGVFCFLWSIMWPLDGICRKKIDTRCICLRSKSFDIPYRGDKTSWRRGSLGSTPLHWDTLRPETDNFWNMTVRKFCYCEGSFFPPRCKMQTADVYQRFQNSLPKYEAITISVHFNG